jgi:hypothetical protein
MADLRVAWWNLENLFDRRNDPNRDPVLQARLNSELVGWTTAVRDRKINQLAQIIEMMFNGAGPDLLGVCEIENEGVVQLLINQLNIPGRRYGVVAHNSRDARGIDVSFIVDRNVLDTANTNHAVVVKRSATRDIFWAEFRERQGNQRSFVAIANHWPSRSGGQYGSEPFRMITGETVSVILDELRSRLGENAPVLVMGDFNDEPYNRSMQEYLLSTRDRNRVTRARNPMLLNMMWPHMSGANPGTYKYGPDWNMLDGFLATRGLLVASTPITIDPHSVQIFRPAVMVGSAGVPIKFGRPSKPRTFNRNGFSDHFPVTCILETDS